MMVGEFMVTGGGSGPATPRRRRSRPQVTGEQDADGNYVGAATVTLDATDADPGVDTVEYSLDGGGVEPPTPQPVAVTALGDAHRAVPGHRQGRQHLRGRRR